MNNFLESRVVKQKLSQDLFENFHAVDEVGEVGQNVAVYFVDRRLPGGSEVSHQPFDGGGVNLDGRSRRVTARRGVSGGGGGSSSSRRFRGRVHLFGPVDELYHLGEVGLQFVFDEEFSFFFEFCFEERGVIASNASLSEDGEYEVVVVDEEDDPVLVLERRSEATKEVDDLRA